MAVKPEYDWKEILTPWMSYGLQGWSLAVCGGNVYVLFASTVATGASQECWKYDAGTKEWARIADAPVGRRNAKTVTVGTKIYCDQTGGATTTDPFLVYDTATNSWEILPVANPTNVWNAKNMTLHEGKIWVIYSQKAYIFDPETVSWEERTLSPGIVPYATASMDGDLYAGVANVLYKLDAQTGQFVDSGIRLPNVERVADLTWLGGVGQELFCISGSSAFAARNKNVCMIYKMNEGRWVEGPRWHDYGFGMQENLVALEGEKIYALYMISGSPVANSLLYLNCADNEDGKKEPRYNYLWRPEERHPSFTTSSAVLGNIVGCGNKVYQFYGGTSGLETWMFDEEMGDWTQKSNIPRKLPSGYTASLVSVGSKIYVGPTIPKDASGALAGSIYDTQTEQWVNITGQRVESVQYGPVAYKNKMWMFGKDNTYLFDLEQNSCEVRATAAFSVEKTAHFVAGTEERLFYMEQNGGSYLVLNDESGRFEKTGKTPYGINTAWGRLGTKHIYNLSSYLLYTSSRHYSGHLYSTEEDWWYQIPAMPAHVSSNTLQCHAATEKRIYLSAGIVNVAAPEYRWTNFFSIGLDDIKNPGGQSGGKGCKVNVTVNCCCCEDGECDCECECVHTHSGGCGCGGSAEVVG